MLLGTESGTMGEIEGVVVNVMFRRDWIFVGLKVGVEVRFEMGLRSTE